MRTRIYKYWLIASFIILFFSPSVWAVPKLQIYIPGSTYNYATESWTINATDYELWVVGANVNIYNVNFTLAVPTNENGSIDITWDQGILTDSKNHILKQPGYSDLLKETSPSFHAYGTPVMDDGKSLPSHGVFPTSYYEYLGGNFGISQTVSDYSPGNFGDTTKGEIKKFHLSVEGYTSVEIDAFGDLKKKNGQSVFAPFSHDGYSFSSTAVVPEPATMFLLGTGLIGLAALGRKKFSKP